MRKWLVIWGLLIGIPLAWAANTQLSNLSAGGAVSATDLFYNVQSAGSGGVKTTAAQLATFSWTSPTITNPTITGSLTATGLVTNAALANPAITVNGQTCTLGSTCTVVAAAGTLTGATLAAGVTGSSLTSVGTLAGLTVTGSLTATGLVTNADLVNAATTVNGQTCTLGSTCTVTAAAGTLTGATLAAGVTASSLTSVGTITTGTWTGTTIAVANGGTGLTSGTSGGVLAYMASGTLASSAALTANNPVIGGGAGVVPASGTRSGNTTVFGTTSGALTSGNCIKSDASGNLIDSGGTCGGSGSPGGSNTQLQYNNSSAFGGTTGLTWDNTNQALTLASIANPAAATMTLTGGAITGASSQPVLNMSQTWNASGTAFTASLLNVTNTASAAASKLMDVQLGGTSIFQVLKRGTGATSGSILVPQIDVGLSIGSSVSGVGVIWAAGSVVIVDSGVSAIYAEVAGVNTGGPIGSFRTNSLGQIGWKSSATNAGSANGTLDTLFTRGAAASIQQGAADVAAPVAQTTQVQSVVAGTSNTAGADWTLKGSKGTGTGAGGDIVFQTAAAGTTGTSQNAATSAFKVKATGVIQNVIIFSAAGTPLPTCNGAAEGSRAAVSDALAPTFLTAYTSGGAVHASVYCDGTSWKTD